MDEEKSSKETTSSPTQANDTERYVFWLGLLLLAGTLLRFYRLGSDLWLDEIASVVTYFRLPFPEIFTTYYSANQHLLYSAAASLSLDLFSDSAWSARLPAALMGAAALPGFWWMARPVVSSREALWGTALLAVSYHHIWFSQSARGYSGMILFTILGTGILVRLSPCSAAFQAASPGGETGIGKAAERSAYRWALYVVLMTLGIGLHQNTAFVLGGHCIAWILLRAKDRNGHRRIAPMILSALAVALLSLGLHSLILPDMLRYFDKVDRTGLGWYDLQSFVPVVMTGLRAGIGLFGLIVLGVVMALGWLSVLRSDPLFAISAATAPLLNLIALVVLRQGAYPRSFLYVLPFALLFAARGGFMLGRQLGQRSQAGGIRRLAEMLPVLLLVAASVSSLPALYRNPKQDYRNALAYAFKHRRSGEIVAAAGLAGVAYRQRYSPGLPIVQSREELSRWCEQGNGAWVLYSFTRDMRLRHPDTYDFIQERMRAAATFPGTLGDGSLYVAHCTGSV